MQPESTFSHNCLFWSATLPGGIIDFKATIWIPANVTYSGVLLSMIQSIRDAQAAPGSCKARSLAVLYHIGRR
jgi:hypothetical protein